MSTRTPQPPLFPPTPIHPHAPVTNDSSFSLTDLESEIQSLAKHIQSSPGSHLYEITELTVPKAPNPKSPPKKAVSQGKDELRPYPKINRRSRLLAEKADARFFSRYNIQPAAVSSRKKEVLESEPTPKPVNLFPRSEQGSRTEKQTTEEKAGEYLSEPIEPLDQPEPPPRLSIKQRIERYLSTPDSPNPDLHRSKPPNISERSKLWLSKREEKIKGRKSAECTFAPVIYTKIPHHLHHLSAERLLHFTSQARGSPSLPHRSSQSSLSFFL